MYKILKININKNIITLQIISSNHIKKLSEIECKVKIPYS